MLHTLKSGICFSAQLFIDIHPYYLHYLVFKGLQAIHHPIILLLICNKRPQSLFKWNGLKLRRYCGLTKCVIAD